MIRPVGARTQRAKRALEVTRVARRSGLLRVLREVGVVGERPATREGARSFRLALERLGTTYIKLGQLLSSRPDSCRTSTATSSGASSVARDGLLRRGHRARALHDLEDHPHARRALTLGVGLAGLAAAS